ncbi:MAG TPA: CBS domain-containing protein [Gammaproteobacteria bacterium]|nr:CBS domain-containing protein [Gammaproteobacteria bacterium]
MSEDDSSNNGSDDRTWLERITRILQVDPRDREHLLEILRDSEKRSLLDTDSLSMIEGVLQVSEMQVRDIMIPRSQMSVLSRTQSPEEMLANIIESGHSRFPVIGDSRDEVEGILLAKDMLRLFRKDSDDISIRDYLRAPVFVPESKRLNVLLKDFRSSHNHLAIVVDEYGGVAGMVTIEDVLEQIVGEIEDEHDIDEGKFILKHDDNHFIVKALTEIEEFNEFFNTSFSGDEFDTIGGQVLNEFGHMPKRDEVVCINDMSFRVLRSDNRRIYLLEVILNDIKKADDIQQNQSSQ